MKKTDVRKETVAKVTEDFNRIVQMVAEAPSGEVLDHVEREARKMALNAYCHILQKAVELRGKEWKRKAAPECECGSKMRMAYRSDTNILTLLGPMAFKRRYYYCGSCKKSAVPFDKEMGLTEFSEGVQRAVVMTGSTRSFGPAVCHLKEIGEIRVSKETVRRLTEKAACKLQEFQESSLLSGQECDEKFEQSDRGYVTMDGTMVNTLEDKWREVKLGAFYDQEKRKQHYVATTLDSEEFGQMMRLHGGNVTLGSAGEIIAGGDGAAWIWNQMEANFPMASYQFLDFYHLSEKVHDCAHSLYGYDNPKGERWVKEKLHLVKHEGGKQLLKALKRSRKRRKSKGANEALTKLIDYLSKHITRTNYPQLQAIGIDIGTGPQESACKNVIGARLKGRGMRWSLTNAEAMARFRAYISDLSNWEKKWKALKRLDRLYAAAA